MQIRIITLCALIIGAFVAPWWSVALGIAICAVAYRVFLDGLIPAIIIDVLYGAHPILGIPGFLTVITGLLILFSVFSEGYLRGHVRI